MKVMPCSFPLGRTEGFFFKLSVIIAEDEKDFRVGCT